MERTRTIAKALMREGVIEITQKGARVDVDSFKGPIRLRLAAVSGVKSESDAPSKRSALADDGHEAVKARDAKRSKPSEPGA